MTRMIWGYPHFRKPPYDYEYLCRSIGLDFSLFFFKHAIHIWPYMFGDRILGVAMRGAAWEFQPVWTMNVDGWYCDW